MELDVKVGAVSWINGTPNPMTMGGLKAGALTPDWVPKTYIGLAATKNGPPPVNLPDFRFYEKGKDFRALLYCHFRCSVDDATGQVAGFETVDALHNPGWTPPFNWRKFPAPLLTFDKEITSSTWHQGEASTLSKVHTQARHPNSAIAIIPPTETVLVNGLIKFRAGAHTDDIGINTVKCPFHVPWVWCELALTYANGRLKLYGQGSMFPSHAWYLNGQQVLRQDEVGDATFPKKRHKVTVPIIGRQFERQSWTEIDEKLLRLYPVLSAGAPAGEPQVPIGDHKGPVYLHPNTAPRKEGSAHVHP